MPGVLRPHRQLGLWMTLLLLLISVCSVAGVTVAHHADAATPGSLAQCNGQGPGTAGATTGMRCDVTIVNTIAGGSRSSTITVSRQCSLDPCGGSSGTFTSTSSDLTTNVNQCNGSDNDATHAITCTVTITNDISADTSGAQPLTPATVDQCVGSAAVGTVSCDPFPAAATDATVTQCNGSANGGGGSAVCSVNADAQLSPAIPITVNQCNGTGNVGGDVLTCSTSITTKIISTVTLSSSASTSTIGTSMTLTATVEPGVATGTVSFFDVPASGPNAGVRVPLGTVALSGGTAVLVVQMSAFGTNSFTVAYSGDPTYTAQASAAAAVQVLAVAGSVIVNQFRLSGPSGANDAYVELYNTGGPVPLAGFQVATASGGVVTLPADAPVLAQYRSYLVTGGAYSLTAIAASDASTSSLGNDGVRVIAPDGNATVTDAVGSSGAGYFLGTPLPALSGTGSAQYAWVRLEAAGRPTNTSNNASNFKLVSTTGGLVGGVTSTLGSPSPSGFTSPFQHNTTLSSALLDAGSAASAAPNRVYTSGAPGTLVVRRSITNTGSATITLARIRISSLSEANGAPLPGSTAPANQAKLRIINPATASSSVALSGNRSVTVVNLSVDGPATATPGGGLATTMTVPLPGGRLTPGASINVAFTFAVDHGGTFWFGYDVDGN